MGGQKQNADFQRLIERRRKFIEGLDANRGEINLDIFEDFYPDRAHFVYELLQNAEDEGHLVVHEKEWTAAHRAGREVALGGRARMK